MKYSDTIKINHNFQTSINLELDLNNERKLKEYIPTTDICDVIKKYLKSFLNHTKDKATVLVGPYGKGKSFLLLVLSYLIGNNQSSSIYQELIAKIKLIDEECYALIEEVNKKNIHLLPVIINSNYDNLNQSFLLALNEALERNELHDIVPKTVYSVCVEVLDKWKNEPAVQERIKNECGKIGHKLDLAGLKYRLTEFDPEAYQQFEEIYNCVSLGVEFNPLVNNDIVKIFSDVNYEICQRGYSGMFIIFDEFSKFLESAGTSLSKDLKSIQDFAELANRSDVDEQINICCVTHKNIVLYSDNKKNDSFKTVEGRFKEIRFNRSLAENYQIISAVIQKKDNEIGKKYFEDNSSFYKEIEESEMYNTLPNFRTVAEGTFPLNPITVYALIALSEQVAQNERTLFTFISDIDENSFNTFIRKNNTGLFNVDKVYDYFSNLLQKDDKTRNIWYRAEAIRTKLDDPLDHKIIKAIAVILMIHELDVMPCNEQIIHLALNEDKDEILTRVDAMIDEHYLRRNIINGMLSFASANSKEIDDQLTIIINSKRKSFKFDEILTYVDDVKYYLPRRYNEQHKMSRFYRNVYLTEDQYLNLNSFSLMKEKSFCDGLVVNVIREKADENGIREVADKIADDTVIVRFPENPVNEDFKNYLLNYAAYRELIRRGGNDEVVSNEIELLKNEVEEDLKSLIEANFRDDAIIYYPLVDKLNSEETGFRSLLSSVFEYVYSKSVIFNNELVNKDIVSSQYQRAVDHVTDWVMNGSNDDEWNYSETSPEATVRNAIVNKIDEQEDARFIVDYFKDEICKSESEKKLLKEIIRVPVEKPYGIRRGILPILFAMAISELSDNVILYLDNKEIELNSSNLAKAMHSERNYYFGFAKGSGVQNQFVYSLLEKLDIKATNNFRKDINLLCDGLRKFFVGLPAILRNCDSSFLGVEESIVKYRSLFMSFSLNPSDLVLNKPLEYFDHSYDKALEAISGFIGNWNTFVDDYKQKCIDVVKSHMNITKESSLKMGVSMYLKRRFGDEKPIMSDVDSTIYNALCNLSYDDNLAIDELTLVTVGSYVEDWTYDRISELNERLDVFLDEINNADMIDVSNSSLAEFFEQTSSVKRTAMGDMIKNNLESVFEDFADSVSKEEKISILAGMLKDLM